MQYWLYNDWVLMNKGINFPNFSCRFWWSEVIIEGKSVWRRIWREFADAEEIDNFIKYLVNISLFLLTAK